MENNFDFLSAERADKETVVSVFEPKEDSEVSSMKVPSIGAILLATVKRDAAFFEAYKGKKKLPRLNFTVLMTISLVAIALFVFIISNLKYNDFFIGYGILIPLVSLLLCVGAPLLIIVFFYELSTERSVKFYSLFISFMIGFALYIALNLLSELLYPVIQREQIDQIGFPLVTTIIFFLMTFLLANNFNAKGMADYYLIAVTLSMGFCFTSNFVSTFAKLFVVDGTVSTGTYTAPPGVGVTIFTGQYLERSYQGIFNNWLFDYMMMPFLFSCWAVISGFVASFTDENRAKNRSTPSSIFFLLLLIIAFNIFAVIDTAADYFGVILKTVALVGSAILEYIFINIALKDNQ